MKKTILAVSLIASAFSVQAKDITKDPALQNAADCVAVVNEAIYAGEDFAEAHGFTINAHVYSDHSLAFFNACSIGITDGRKHDDSTYRKLAAQVNANTTDRMNLYKVIDLAMVVGELKAYELGYKSVAGGTKAKTSTSSKVQNEMKTIKGVTVCDISRTKVELDENGDETGKRKVLETVKGGASIAFDTGKASLTIPWDEQEKKGDTYTRELLFSGEGQSLVWGNDDSQSLSFNKDKTFEYYDGPGIHRSVYTLTNCKKGA